MKKYSLLILLLFGLLSTSFSQQPFLSGNYYKHFTGTVAGQPVIADIQSINGIISGSYEYEKHREPITLTCIVSRSNRTTMTFGEDIDEDDSAQPYPEWRCIFINGRLTGTWYSADKRKTFPILLKEDYPQGVMRFAYNYFDTTAEAFPGKENTSVCDIEYSYPVSSGSNMDARWINKEIKSLLGFDTAQTFRQGLKKSYNDYIKDYRKNMLSDSALYDSYAGNWQNNTDISVRYNNKGYVILQNNVYDYSGGAHGNPGCSYICYDIKSEAELKLNDITIADSVTLQHLLEAQFRSDNNMNATDSLTGILFKNHLPPNDNFSFDDTGIYFTYNPYEVAPYAEGIFTVFIPYDKLRGKLVPAFTRRMNIK